MRQTIQRMRQLARALLQSAVMPGAHLDDEVEVFVPRVALLLYRGLEAARVVGSQGGDRACAIEALARVLSRAARDQLKGDLIVAAAESESVDEERAFAWLYAELETAQTSREEAGPDATMLRDVAEHYEVLARHLGSAKRKVRLLAWASRLREMAAERDESRLLPPEPPGPAADPELEPVRAALRERIEEAGLRPTAREVGMSPYALQNIAHGRTRPSSSTLGQLAEWYVRIRRNPPPPSRRQILQTLRSLAHHLPEDDRNRVVNQMAGVLVAATDRMRRSV